MNETEEVEIKRGFAQYYITKMYFGPCFKNKLQIIEDCLKKYWTTAITTKGQYWLDKMFRQTLAVTSCIYQLWRHMTLCEYYLLRHVTSYVYQLWRKLFCVCYPTLQRATKTLSWFQPFWTEKTKREPNLLVWDWQLKYAKPCEQNPFWYSCVCFLLAQPNQISSRGD